jgi:hypothetical protein
VAPASHATDGVEETVVAEVESVCEPLVKVVEVAVRFQPVPDPVASLTSKPCEEVTDWSAPFNVAEKVLFPGADTNASEPAVRVAVAVDARAPVAGTMIVASAIAAAIAQIRVL